MVGTHKNFLQQGHFAAVSENHELLAQHCRERCSISPIDLQGKTIPDSQLFYLTTGSTVNPQFKPRALVNFMVHNHPGSNHKRVEIEI